MFLPIKITILLIFTRKKGHEHKKFEHVLTHRYRFVAKQTPWVWLHKTPKYISFVQHQLDGVKPSVGGQLLLSAAVTCKTVAEIYFGGGGPGRGCFPRPFLPFPSFHLASLPSLPVSFPRVEVAPQIQLRDLGSAVRLVAGQNDIRNHQTRSLGSKYTNKCVCGRCYAADAFLAFLEPMGNVSDGCKCRPVSVKSNLKI